MASGQKRGNLTPLHMPLTISARKGSLLTTEMGTCVSNHMVYTTFQNRKANLFLQRTDNPAMMSPLLPCWLLVGIWQDISSSKAPAGLSFVVCLLLLLLFCPLMLRSRLALERISKEQILVSRHNTSRYVLMVTTPDCFLCCFGSQISTTTHATGTLHLGAINIEPSDANGTQLRGDCPCELV